MKKTFEITSIVTLILIALFVVSAYGIRTALFKGTQQDENTEVLGTSIDGMNHISISKIQPITDEENLVVLSSATRIGEFLYFDNSTREYLEGVSSPNSSISIQIGSFVETVKTDPSGFFSIKIPEDLDQFSTGQITIFNSKNNVTGGFQFVFVQKSSLGRAYFVLPERSEIFSIEIPEDYSSERKTPFKWNNMTCSVELKLDINQETFDFTKDNNIILLPKTISSIDFEENKYIALEIQNLDEGYTNCFSKWYSYGISLQWHTETAKAQLDLNTGIPAPYSAPMWPLDTP